MSGLIPGLFDHSSTVTSKDDEIVNPKAFAILESITSLSGVDSKTGIAAKTTMGRRDLALEGKHREC